MKRITFLPFVILMFIGLKNNYAQAPDWTRVLQLNVNSYNTFSVVTSDANNIYSAASLYSNISFEGSNFTTIGQRDLLIIKTSHDGVVGWMKQFNAGVNGIIYANALKIDGSGNIYVSGILSGSSTIGSSTITSDPTHNAFIAKFDTDGNGLWATTFLSTGSSYSRIALDASENLYLISSSSKLLKFNSSGIKQWEQSFADKTLQGIAIYGSNLYLGGCLQDGTTNFGSIPLTSLGGINTGFIVKADLDGNYNNSIIVGGSTTDKGSSVSDIICDNSGNLIITGGFVDGLILGAITINKSNLGLYAYVAKCDANFTFAWAKASTELFYENTNAMWFFRVFLDNSNNIYQYSMNVGLSVTYGSVSASSSSPFIFKFDSNGNATNGYNVNIGSCTNTYISPNGKITLESTDTSEGADSYGNIYISQLNNDVSLAWKKISSNSLAGRLKLGYIKHDAAGNTYLSSRLLGFCNYFGTNITSNKTITVISKHDINGNLLWMNQISDLNPSINGSSFILDRDNNIITCGFFKTSLTIGTATLTTSNIVSEGYVAKYSSTGNFLWAEKMDLGEDVSSGITVATDKDRNVIVSGVISPSNFIVKFNANGSRLWAKTFPMESYYSSLISTDNENNIYLTSEIDITSTGSATIGTIILNQTSEDGGTALIKFDPNGNALWAKTYGGIDGSSWPTGWAVDIRTDATGNSYLWGWCENNAKFGTNTFTNPFTPNEKFSFYLAKINTSGDVVWAKAIYEAKRGINYGDLLDLDNTGNIYVGGHFRDNISLDGNIYTPEGLYDFFTIKFSNEGVFQWIKTIPSNNLIINGLSAFDNNVLTLVGAAGKNPTLGSTTINSKGGINAIVATLGNLKYINVSSNALSIASTANSTNTFNITSNISWTVLSNQTWITPSSTNGSGNTTITLTASINPTITTRTATVTVSGSGVSGQTITVTQDAGAATLSVSSNSLTIAALANSTNTFNITSNINWTANSDQTWLTTSSASGSGNATITLTATANPNTVIRTATITVSGSNVASQTVTVTQDASSTGIDEIAGLEKVKIYPNPSNGRFTLSLNHYNDQKIEVSICDALGNTLKKFSLNKIPEIYTDEINLEGVAKGLYFVIIKTAKERIVKSITITNP